MPPSKKISIFHLKVLFLNKVWIKLKHNHVFDGPLCYSECSNQQFNSILKEPWGSMLALAKCGVECVADYPPWTFTKLILLTFMMKCDEDTHLFLWLPIIPVVRLRSNSWIRCSKVGTFCDSNSKSWTFFKLEAKSSRVVCNSSTRLRLQKRESCQKHYNLTN